MGSTSASVDLGGVPDFQVIDIDPIQVARALQGYLERGSKLTGVSLDDIDRRVVSLPAKDVKLDLVALLKIGMKLFDAIIWLSAGKPTSHPLQVDPGMTEESVLGLHAVAKAVFYSYFFLLTQARYPATKNDPNTPNAPNFLRVVMGLTEPQHHYIEQLCSFPPQQFDPKWIKSVNFARFGQEAISRFGLGVAGYRLFGPFKNFSVKPNLPENLQKSVAFAKTIATSEASWNIHPVTRSPGVLSRRGNLNKNLGNLILDVFTDDQINEMVKCKMLYAVPTREANYREYLTWQSTDDISGNDPIFRAPA